MAEINSSISSAGISGIKRKVLSTRVDLTPMVDLGFLLITFFIFTTSMSQPSVMRLHVPNDSEKNPMHVPESKTINLILGSNYWDVYHGNEMDNTVKVTSVNQLRNILIEKRKAVASQTGNPKDMIVITQI